MGVVPFGARVGKNPRRKPLHNWERTPSGAERKNRRHKIPLTETERDRLEALAAELGLSLTSLLRSAAIGLLRNQRADPEPD